MTLQQLKLITGTACGIAVAVSLAGCARSGDGPELYPVHGTVTFDGEPVETGRITFRETAGDNRAFSGEITDGTYDVETEAGPMVVEIIASRPIPGKFDNSNGTPEPVGEMYIPAKYNSETTLTHEIKAGENTVPFDLKSE